jgi:hypothetical protein
MAETFYFGKELKVYLENNKGELWQIAVNSEPSFSQSVDQETVSTPSLIAGGTTRNSVNKFTKNIKVGYSPGEWSFSTFVRPFNQDSKERAVEDVLWESFAQGSATAYADSPSSVSATKQDITLSKDELLSSFNLYFIYENNTGYVMKNCVVSSASTSVDIASLATISWSGSGTSLEKFDPQDLVQSADNSPQHRSGNIDSGKMAAMDGNTAIFAHSWENEANTNNYDGAAHVYITNDGGCTWEFQQTLRPNEAGSHEYFGVSMALEGDKLVISAVNRLSGDGGFYYFTRSAGVWTLVAGYSSPDFDEDQGDDDGVAGDWDDDRLGQSIAMSGNYVVTGVSGHDSGDTLNDNIGAAVVWKLVNNAWVQKAILYNTDGTGDQYGRSVQVDGDRIVIPSRKNVFTYITSDAGENWSLEQTLSIASGTQPISTSNEICNYNRQGGTHGTIVLGMAYQDPHAGVSDSGTVMIITHNGTAWSVTQTIASPLVAAQHFFGRHIDFDGTTLLVGAADDYARWGSTDTNYGRGKLYQYNLNGSTWELTNTLDTQKAVSLDGAMGRANHSFTLSNGNILTRCLENRTGLSVATTTRTVASITAAYITLNARYNPRSYDSVIINGQRYFVILVSPDGVTNAIALSTNWVQHQDGRGRVDCTTLGLTVNDSLVFEGENIHSWHFFKAAFHPSMCENKTGLALTDNYIVNKLSSMEFGLQESKEVLYRGGMLPDSPASYDYFGAAMDMHYPWLIVSAYGDNEAGKADNGSVHVFKFDEANNAWVFKQTLLSFSPEDGGQFGGPHDGNPISISPCGRQVAIGEQGRGANTIGRVNIFSLKADLWQQEAIIDPTGTAAGDTYLEFGRDVSLYHNMLIVGCWLDNTSTGNDKAGSAAIYRREGALWTKREHLVGSDHGGTSAAHDYFGRGVAIYDGVAIVCASGEGAGTYYSFKSTNNGKDWSLAERQYLPTGASSGGRQVKLAEGTMIIGDHGLDGLNGLTNTGGVFVYNTTSTLGVFNHVTTLVPTNVDFADLEANDYFGLPVDMDTSENGKNVTIVAGGHTFDTNGIDSAGVGYIWNSTDYGKSWSEGRTFHPSKLDAVDTFGHAVAVSNGHIAGGARRGEVPGIVGTDPGYVATFRTGVSFPITAAEIQISNSLTPISYPLLGEMDKPLGFSSGPQQVSGSFSGYIMDDGGLDTKEFISSLFDNTIQTLPLSLNFGGTKANTNRLKFNLNKATLSNPSISGEGIAAFIVEFSAEDTQTQNSDSTDIVKITYKSSSVA